jgi:ferredoxin
MPASNIKTENSTQLSADDKGSSTSEPLSVTPHVFELTYEKTQSSPPDFSLTSDTVAKPDNDEQNSSIQGTLFLPQEDPETPAKSPQIDLQGMQPKHFSIDIHHPDASQSPAIFQYAPTLLESLESQGITLPFQCRDGYCGSCRTTLINGSVTYQQEPMAWLNDQEILPCCCIPTSDITIKLNN